MTHVETKICWFCEGTRDLRPRERDYDSAPLAGWECQDCRDASIEYRRRAKEIYAVMLSEET